MERLTQEFIVLDNAIIDASKAFLNTKAEGAKGEDGVMWLQPESGIGLTYGLPTCDLIKAANRNPNIAKFCNAYMKKNGLGSLPTLGKLPLDQGKWQLLVGKGKEFDYSIDTSCLEDHKHSHCPVCLDKWIGGQVLPVEIDDASREQWQLAFRIPWSGH